MTIPLSPSNVNVKAASETLNASVKQALSERHAPARQADLESAFAKFLAEAGRGVRTPAGVYWLDEDGRAWVPASTEFLVKIADLAGAPTSSREVRAALVGAADRVCRGQGHIEATPIHLSSLGTDGALYLRRDDTTLLKVTASGVSEVLNGTAGLVIIGGDGFAPVGDLPPPMAPLLNPLFQLIARCFRFRDLELIPGAFLVSLLVVYYLLPRDLAGSRPVTLLLGAGGAGKTTLMRILLYVLWGPKARIEAPPDRYAQRDFETLLGTAGVLGVDDPDQGEKAPWLGALVRAVVTGAARRRRKLYSDTDVIEIQPDPRLVIAANENPFPRSDADSSRVFPLWLEPRTGPALPEGQLEAEAVSMRAQVWSDALELLSRALQSGQVATSASQRLSRFQMWMETLAEQVAMREVVREALGVLDVTRSDLILEDHQVADAVERFAVPGKPWQGSASELLGALRGKPEASMRDTAWDGWTPERIGRVLAEIAPAMAASRGIRITQLRRRGSGRRWRIERIETGSSSPAEPSEGGDA